MEEVACPKCHSAYLKRTQLPNCSLLHWVLNPGLAVNELILGQRIPKLTFECRSCQLPYAERNFIPCPSCNTLHDSRVWTGRNGIGNWLGLICPTCSARIPCLWNLTSLLILLLLSPVWYLPYRLYFKDRRVSPPTGAIPDSAMITPKTSVRMGFFFGAMMWVAVSLVPTLVRYARVGTFDFYALLFGAGVCLLAGATFGILMHFTLNRKGGKRGG